jgi:hypothetical protein
VRVVVEEGEAGNVGGSGGEVHLPLLPPGDVGDGAALAGLGHHVVKLPKQKKVKAK